MCIFSILILFFINICLAYDNILINNIPNVTHNENSQFFNLNNLNDENLDTLYSTGIIRENTTAIINYSLNSIYCLDSLDIYWINIPTYFIVNIIENNIINTFRFNNNDDSSGFGEYYTDNSKTEIELCNNNIYTNKININIINNSTKYVHYMIRDIQARGYDVINQLLDINPSKIPINSIPDFYIDVRNGVEIRISNNNKCENTYHLDNYKFEESREYKLCYKKFEQPISIFVDTISNITPSILHISSFTKLYVHTNNSYISLVGLSRLDCRTNTISSISNIISNTIDFFEQGNSEGDFDLCYSFNGLWGNTKHKIKLVKPIIYSLSGCENNENITSNCPTEGNKNMTIKGQYFFNYYNNPIIRYGDSMSIQNILVNDNTIISILPEGTGNDIKVSVRFEIESDSKILLSYKKPEINYITGCTSEYPKIVNCPNDDNFKINIIGNNFGYSLSTILIGSNMCQNITHISHKNISCSLSGNRGINNVVYVIQHKGEISNGQKLISYRECDKGYELVDNKCQKCKIGYYKNKVSDNLCMLCTDGTYTNSTGNIICKKCVINSISNEIRSNCLCNEGYYMDSSGNCIECNNLDFFGNIIYLCKTSGLTIKTLKNEDGYWRMNENTINFYKCRKKNNCPINSIINNSITCKKFHTGILCDFCEKGYAKNNNGDCQLCEGGSGIVSGMFVLIIGIYIVFVILSLIIGNKYVNKLANKVIDNELKDEVVEDEEENEEENEEEDEEIEINKNSYDYTKDTGSQLLQKLKIMITYIQINTILSINLNLKWPQFMTKVMDAFKSINLEIFDFVGLSYRCSVEFNFYHIFIFQMFMIPIMFFLTSLSFHLVKLWGEYKNKSKDFYRLIHNRYIYILVLLVFILYPNVCNTILQLYKCEKIEDKYYLSNDLSLECYDNTWNNYSVAGSFFIIIYILGIPYVFYRKLKYFYDANLLDTKEIMYKYGFMYGGYDREMWWFEILELMRKTILSASIIYLDESATRIIVAMIVCGIYLLYLAYNQPRKDPRDVFLSILSATEIFLLLFCGLILEVKIDIKDKYNQVAFDGIMFVIFILILAVGNYQIIQELRENNVFTLIKKLLNKIKKIIIKYYNIICNPCSKRKEEYVIENTNTNKIFRIIRETEL